MNLPGRAKTHVWTGLVVALVGVGVGAYAYTGDRVYHLEFVAVALGGLALVVGGSTLAGYGQANRPRLGGAAARDDEEDEDEPSILERLKGLFVSEEEADPVEATVECPSCEHVFDAEGTPPFEATCPACEHTDTVEVPDAIP